MRASPGFCDARAGTSAYLRRAAARPKPDPAFPASAATMADESAPDVKPGDMPITIRIKDAVSAAAAGAGCPSRRLAHTCARDAAPRRLTARTCAFAPFSPRLAPSLQDGQEIAFKVRPLEGWRRSWVPRLLSWAPRQACGVAISCARSPRPMAAPRSGLRRAATSPATGGGSGGAAGMLAAARLTRRRTAAAASGLLAACAHPHPFPRRPPATPCRCAGRRPCTRCSPRSPTRRTRRPPPSASCSTATA
jgi:hypothetical protein